MNCLTRSICLALTVGLVFGLAQVAPINAQSVDCSTADATLVPGQSLQSITPTGDIDKDFVALMKAENKSMMAAMHTEMSCGKDPSVKAMAQKSFAQEEARARQLDAILGGGH